MPPRSSIGTHQTENAQVAFASVLGIEFLVRAGDHSCSAAIPPCRRTGSKNALARVGQAGTIRPGIAELLQGVTANPHPPALGDRIGRRKVDRYLVAWL